MNMTNNHVCLECGVSGVTKDLVNCANCCSYAIHRYCMSAWPYTKRLPVYWFCGCEEEEIVSNQSQESEQIGSSATDDDDEEEVSNLWEENSSSRTSTIHSDSGTNQQRVLSKFMKSFTSQGKLYGPGKKAEPVIISIWSGSFQIQFMHDVIRPLNGITAFLSNKADKKAWDETVEFGPVIKPEMVMKELVWPQETALKDEDLAVYFFPTLGGVDQQVYDCLVFEMIRNDLAMRLDSENAEIFIFTSVDLIPRLRRFQGNCYLWGFFRLKHTSNDENPHSCTSC